MPIVPVPSRQQKVITRLRWLAIWIERGDIVLRAQDLADLILEGSISRHALTGGKTLGEAAREPHVVMRRLRERADEIEQLAKAAA